MLTTDEVADLLRVHPDTVRKWRRTNSVLPARKIGRQYRYSERDVERLVGDSDDSGRGER